MKNDNKKLIISLSIVICVLLAVVLFLAIIGENQDNLNNKVYLFSQKCNENKYSPEKEGIIHSYEEYQDLLNSLEFDETNQNNNIKSSQFNEYNFLYYFVQIDKCYEELEFNNVEISNYIATINFDVKNMCEYCENYNNLYLIRVDKDSSKNIEEVKVDFEIVKESNKCDRFIVDKPILYLYPKEDIFVNIKLKYSDKIKTSYPKYNNGWYVLAKPNGSLYDVNNKYYYALYWDEESNSNVDFSEGFYVTKDEAIKFLEEKLTIIGLNNKEKNEFIMYWLPKLEDNEKSLVYFELTEERQKENELIINPAPDSLLRVNMHVKKVNTKTEIKEQELPSFERRGFVAVEWGGTIH